MALTKAKGHILADDLALGGNPTTTNQNTGNNTTRIATTAFVQQELNPKSTIASPTFTGTPAAPTASGSTNTTQLATTAFVQQEISSLVDGAPSTLNTLNEIAAALNDDAALNTTLTNSIATKLPLAGGTLTSGIVIGGDSSINRGNQTSGELLIGGTTDGGFVDFDGTNLQLNTQRDPNTGAFINTGKSNARIEISGPAGGSHIAFRTINSNNASASERMRIDSAGNVLIKGTGYLDLEEGFRIRSASGQTGTIGFNRDPAGGGHLGQSGLARYQINGPFSGSDFLDFQNYNSSGTYTGGFRLQDGAIRAAPLGVSTPSYAFNNDTNTGMTRPTGDTLQLVTGGVERIRIDSSGLVGIGMTPAANFALEVQATSGGNALRLKGRNAAENAGWLAWTDYAGNVEAAMYATADNLIFANTTSYTERMRIDGNGKVSIGTNTPGNNHAKANNLVVGSGSAGGMAVYNGTAEGWYAFSRGNANNADAYDGGISYNGDRQLKFHTNSGAVRMMIDGSGNQQFYGNIGLEDSKLMMFGGGQDARLYFDASTNALMITASNGTANTVNIVTNNFQIGGATPLISGTANDSVVINQDGSSSVDFRVESDNQDHNFFCDASSEIIHFGEGTNSDLLTVIPAGVLNGRRHGYHGGQRQHSGQTFKFCESTGWTNAIKIDWNNPSWGAVCLRITGQYYYNASNNFSVVIGLAGHSSNGSVSYDATSSGAMNWTTALSLGQTATGETTISQRAGDTTGDVIYRYEWQCYARSDQEIQIIDL